MTHWAALVLTAAPVSAEHPRQWLGMMRLRDPHARGCTAETAEVRMLSWDRGATTSLQSPLPPRRCSRGDWPALGVAAACCWIEGCRTGGRRHSWRRVQRLNRLAQKLCCHFSAVPDWLTGISAGDDTGMA